MSLQSHTALSLTAHKLASSTAQRGLHGRPLTCCLQALTSRHGSAVSPTTLAAALQEVVPLLSDGDLLIAALSLNFCGSLVRAQPHEAQAAVERVLPPTLALTKSPLLQVGPPCPRSVGLPGTCLHRPAGCRSAQHRKSRPAGRTCRTAVRDQPL